MCDWGCELDVAHALTPDLGTRNFHATAVADDALVADFLVFTTVALPVLGRAEDALAEEPVFFRAQSAVVNRLWLGHLAV